MTCLFQCNSLLQSPSASRANLSNVSSTSTGHVSIRLWSKQFFFLVVFRYSSGRHIIQWMRIRRASETTNWSETRTNHRRCPAISSVDSTHDTSFVIAMRRNQIWSYDYHSSSYDSIFATILAEQRRDIYRVEDRLIMYPRWRYLGWSVS